MFIAVLPATLLQLLDSRLPYVIGIMASTYAHLITSCTFQFDEVYYHYLCTSAVKPRSVDITAT